MNLAKAVSASAFWATSKIQRSTCLNFTTMFMTLWQRWRQILLGVCLCLSFLYTVQPPVVLAATDQPDHPVIEWLKFAVPAAEQSKFIEQEIAIWNPIDRRSPAFIRKEIWQDPESADNLIVVVYWSSQRQRKIIDPVTVKAAEQAFDQAMGKSYPILEKKEFLNLS